MQGERLKTKDDFARAWMEDAMPAAHPVRHLVEKLDEEITKLKFGVIDCIKEHTKERYELFAEIENLKLRVVDLRTCVVRAIVEFQTIGQDHLAQVFERDLEEDEKSTK